MLNAFSAAIVYGLAALIATSAAMRRAKADKIGHRLMYVGGSCILACAFSLGILFERWMAS